MYTLILLTQYGIQFWHELAYTLLHSLKFNLNICGTSACFSLTFDLHCYLNCTQAHICPDQIWIEINLIRTWVTYPHSHNPLSHHVYTQTYVCKPDDKCRVNTDLPPLKSGEHKINNIEWATNPNTGINNLHVIYMILCIMRGWFDG